MVGAIAASLPVMVANLSIGKKKYAEAEPELRALKVKAEQLRAVKGVGPAKLAAYGPALLTLLAEWQ